MTSKNWTGFDVGPYGVKGVPKTASCLFNWGRGKGVVIVEENFSCGEEDLFEDELSRLHGHRRMRIAQEFTHNGFRIFNPKYGPNHSPEEL